MKKIVTGAVLLLASSPAFSGLIDRGNGMIYDDVLDITWLQDANYAFTSGYAAENLSGAWYLGNKSTDVKASGHMGWDAANEWAEQLVYGGFDDWRLTKASNNDKTCSNSNFYYGCISTDNELSYMFYENLGLHGFYDSNWASDSNWHATGGGEQINNSFTDSLTGQNLSILNLISSSYWSESLHPTSASYALDFSTTKGSVGDSHINNARIAWAVRDGDVLLSTEVPEPSSLAVFGLAGLLLAGRRFSRK